MYGPYVPLRCSVYIGTELGPGNPSLGQVELQPLNEGVQY